MTCFPIIEKTNKFVRLNEIKQGIHDFMLKCTSGLTVHRLEMIILSCSSFLAGRSGTVPFFCSTACSSAAIGVKMSDYGTLP